MPASEEGAYAAALSGLPGMGPATLVKILERRAPRDAWEAVRSGALVRPETPGRPVPAPGRGRSAPSWREIAGRMDPSAWWGPIAGRGVQVTWRGRPDYPEALMGDPHPPGVLFWRGRLGALGAPCVAIVGTRNATPDGKESAYELGRDLAEAGVCVVSGLALGIDAAAHRGALDAVVSGSAGGPVGVAASGVDVPYPRRHGELWEQVVSGGAVLSENLPGRPAQSWRFPSRNRVIAGLVRMVVVVESHAAGGSLITAEAAIERGIDVRAVPGPVRSPASAGSNQLLYDGPGPVRHAQDVLDALGIIRSGGGGGIRDLGPDRVASPGPGSSRLEAPERRVLQEIGWRPVTAGMVVERTNLQPGTVLKALDELQRRGLVLHEGGWWSRRR